jgi:hypothetical protein
MSVYLSLPFDFIKFWFFEAPRDIFLYFLSLNNAFLQQFSLPLLLRTFFKPLKNEYREGLIWFSIAMGIFIKTWLILIDLAILLILILIEVSLIAIFIFWPLATIILLFLKI